MYGRVLRDTALHVAYRSLSEDMTTPFKCKETHPYKGEIEIPAKLPNGRDVPGKEKDIIPCGRDTKFVERTFPGGKRAIFIDQENITRVFVLGPEQKKSAIYVVNHPDEYLANMIESSPNNRASVAEYKQKIQKLLENPPYCAKDTAGIDIGENLSGLTEDIDVSDLEAGSAVDDIIIDVDESPFADPKALDAIISDYYSGRWDIHLIPKQYDDTELHLSPIEPESEEDVIELTEEVKGLDEKVGGLRKMDLENEKGISENMIYNSVKAAMAACAAYTMDDVTGTRHCEKLVVIGKGFAFEMPIQQAAEEELSDEEEDRLIEILYSVPAIKRLKAGERYKFETATLKLGKRFLRAYDALEKDKNRFLIYTAEKIEPDDITDNIEGNIAVYCVDEKTISDFIEHTFKSCEEPARHSEREQCRIAVEGRKIYFVGRIPKALFQERVDRAQLEEYMLGAKIDDEAPASMPATDPPLDALGTVTRIILNNKEGKIADNTLTLVGGESRKDPTEDDISELLRDEAIEEIILLTEKGTNDQYKGEHASGEEEFMKTLFPDGKAVDVGDYKIDPKKVIVLEHYKLKINNGKKA